MQGVPLPQLDPQKKKAKALAALRKRKQQRRRGYSGNDSSSSSDDEDYYLEEEGEDLTLYADQDYVWRGDDRYPQVREPFPASWPIHSQPLELFVWDIKTHVELDKSNDVDAPLSKQIVRVYGLTEAGHTVALDIHGFRPYFYCLPPIYPQKGKDKNLETDASLGKILCAKLQRAFFAYLSQCAKAKEERYNNRCKAKQWGSSTRSPVPQVTVTLERKRNIYTFYPPTPSEIEANQRANAGSSAPEDIQDDGGYREIMLRVETGTKWEAEDLIRAINRVDHQGAKLEDDGESGRLFCDLPAVTFEGLTLQHMDKLLNDHGIVGCGWLHVPAQKYTIRRDIPIRHLVASIRSATSSNLFASGFYKNRPLTQAVATCHVSDVKALPERQSFPRNMRMLSFDLETTMLGKEDDRVWSEPLNLDTSLTPADAFSDDNDDEDDNGGGAEDTDIADHDETRKSLEEEHPDKLTTERTTTSSLSSLSLEASVPDPNFQANKEPYAAIIQISAVLYQFPEGKIIHKAIFSLGSLLKSELNDCDDGGQQEEEDLLDAKAVKVQAFCFGNNPGDRQQFQEQQEEERMLRAFSEYCAVADPDLYTGYNILGFDWDYLVSRYKHYNLPALLGRSGCPVEIRVENFESRAFGARQYKRPSLDGRISMDMRVEVERGTRKKLRRYTLNAVCEAHLRGQNKLVR